MQTLSLTAREREVLIEDLARRIEALSEIHNRLTAGDEQLEIDAALRATLGDIYERTRIALAALAAAAMPDDPHTILFEIAVRVLDEI